MNAQPQNARWLALTAGLIFLGGGILSADVSSPNSKTGKTKPVEARAVDTYGKMPLTFEANQGQTDAKVKFLARGDGYGLFLTPTEAVLSFGKPDAASRALHLRWVGANTAPRVSGREEQTGKVNYLKGNDPSGWRRNVPIFARVSYESIYPGIDLVFYGNQRQLEHDYVVAPGTDPRTIRFTFEGADQVEINRSGELVIHVGGEEVRLHRPIAYQDTRAGRGPIPVDYRLIARGEPGLPEVGFTVGIYDPGTALVIDPVLVYSSYLGGGNYDEVLAIAVDDDGNTYLAGGTLSFNFPLTPDAIQRFNWKGDAFLTKVDTTGALVYSTYLGGRDSDWADDIALDAEGYLLVTGTTSSLDFPRIKPLPSQRGELDVFVMKFDPSNSLVIFSTVLGGHKNDYGFGIATDPAGSIYLTGMSNSPDFLSVNPLQPALHGSYDVFVTKITSDGSEIDYSTFLGGTGQDRSSDIETDSTGHTYVVGDTSSPDFPTVRAVQSSLRGSSDAFVVKLHPSGSSLVYSTYLGGIQGDGAYAIADDSSGNVYVAGETFGEGFPTLNPLQPSLKSGPDGFVTKISPDGELVYSTYLGAGSLDTFMGIAVDSSGAATVAGITTSLDYPVKDPLQVECTLILGVYCSGDVVVTSLNPQGSAITFSTFMGGMRWDFARDLALDREGNIYIAGSTSSEDFPTVAAFQPAHGGNPDTEDGFVARIAFNRPPDCSTAKADPDTIWPPNGRLFPVALQGIADRDGDPITLAVTGIRQDEPLTRAGVQDATGLGTSTAAVRADRVGRGDGRVYHLHFEARDDKGATCTGTVKVCVPHDQRPGATCGDGGALFDSTGQ